MARGSFTDRELAHAAAYIVNAIEERFGGNQSAAAAAFGCNPSTLNRIKSGQRKPVALVGGVARALGVTMDEVLGRKASTKVVPTVAQDVPRREVEYTERYHFRDEAKQALIEDGLSERDAERALAAVVAFDEGDNGSSALHLYRAAKHLLAAMKGKAVGIRELEE